MRIRKLIIALIVLGLIFSYDYVAKNRIKVSEDFTKSQVTELLQIVQEEREITQAKMKRQLEISLDFFKTTDVEDIDDIKEANLLIVNKTKQGHGSGTHIKINGQSYILTCAHSLNGDESELIGYLDNGDEYPLQLIKVNREKDLALFKIEGIENLSYIEISDEFPKEGSEVLVIGNPDNLMDMVTDGIIAKVDKDGYMFTNKTFFGNSGGGVLYRGKLIGVSSQIIGLQLSRRDPLIISYGRSPDLEAVQEFLRGIK